MALTDELIDALRDENGLAPTDGAQWLLGVVLDSIDHTDRTWQGRGSPNLDSYVADLQAALRTAL